MAPTRQFPVTLALCFGALLTVSWSARASKNARASLQALNQPLDLATYTQDLHQWIGAVDHLSAKPKRALSLAAQIPSSLSVNAGGVHSTISMSWLRRRLANLPKNPKASAEALRPLISHLKAMQREAQQLGSPADPELRSAPQKLSQILANPEFVIRPEPPKTWLDKLEERFEKWLGKFFGQLGARVVGHGTLVKFLLWTLLIGVGTAVFLSMFLWVVRRSASSGLALAIGPEGPTPSWESTLGEAKTAATRGEYREAIRLAHRAAIFRLEAVGLWTIDRARTHREYLRLLDSSQPAREPLEALTRQFELAWFGGRTATLTDFQYAVAQLEKLGCG